MTDSILELDPPKMGNQTCLSNQPQTEIDNCAKSSTFYNQDIVHADKPEEDERKMTLETFTPNRFYSLKPEVVFTTLRHSISNIGFLNVGYISEDHSPVTSLMKTNSAECLSNVCDTCFKPIEDDTKDFQLIQISEAYTQTSFY